MEYADVLGIPFDFTAKPVVAPPQPPREAIHVKAVRPERDSLEIRFPRVAGYRVELPTERLTAAFNADSVMELTPDLVGATETQNSGIIGERADLTLVHTGDIRPSQVLYELASHLVLTKWRDPGEDPKLHLFGQLKRIAKQWLDGSPRAGAWIAPTTSSRPSLPATCARTASSRLPPYPDRRRNTGGVCGQMERPNCVGKWRGLRTRVQAMV